MGLLGSMIAGGVKGYANQKVSDIQKQEEYDLKRQLLQAEYEKNIMLKKAGVQIEQEAEEAKYQKTTQRNIDDLAKIKDASERDLATRSLSGLGDAATGASVDAESLQALKDNPQALDAYRKAGAKGLLNSTRQEQAEADANAALSIGRTDYADKFENVAKGERADAKLEAQIKRDDERWKIDRERMDKQFTMQMNRAAASEAAAERRFNSSESNATIRAMQNSMVEALKSNSEAAKDISRQIKDARAMGDEEQVKELTSMYNDKLKEVERISTNLEKYATTGKFEGFNGKDSAQDVVGTYVQGKGLVYGDGKQQNKTKSQPLKTEAPKVQSKPKEPEKPEPKGPGSIVMRGRGGRAYEIPAMRGTPAKIISLEEARRLGYIE